LEVLFIPCYGDVAWGCGSPPAGPLCDAKPALDAARTIDAQDAQLPRHGAGRYTAGMRTRDGFLLCWLNADIALGSGRGQLALYALACRVYARSLSRRFPFACLATAPLLLRQLAASRVDLRCAWSRAAAAALMMDVTRVLIGRITALLESLGFSSDIVSLAVISHAGWFP